MAIEALLAGGALLFLGAAFAVFLGVASSRIEHQREHDAGKSGAH